MYNTESILKNEKHNILGNAGIQSDTLNPAKRQDVMLINKKNKTSGFC